MKKTVRVAHRASNYITSLILAVVIAVCVGAFLYESGLYLHGDDIYAQLYKLDAVAASMREGAWFRFMRRIGITDMKFFGILRLPLIFLS